MNIPYRIYDVFADAPFAGTQIAVVLTDGDLDDSLKQQMVSEFSHSDTVFVNKANPSTPFSVFNEQGKTTFGAHTILAATQIAHELGFSHSAGNYLEYLLQDGALAVNTFIDKSADDTALTLFSRQFNFTVDNFVPELSRIAHALRSDVKHLSYSRYKPRVVNVDTPVLVVPMTRPEHVLAAQLDNSQWTSLLADVYANTILLIAPGSITGQSNFHGRLIHPDLGPRDYPPIGQVIPEFIAYLCSDPSTAKGTHSVTIDRGGLKHRQSLIHTEFDYRHDKYGSNRAKCRIGGKVVLMSEGQFVYRSPAPEARCA